MTIVASRNQAQIVLQVSFSEPDGTPKTGINTATVRVYSVVNGSEVDALSETSLSQVGSTNIYRNIWEPESISIGQYHVLYAASDLSANESLVTTDLSVLNVPTWTEAEILRKIGTGRWKIENNQITYYDDDGVTPVVTFNTFNRRGEAAMAGIMERIPV